MLNWTVFQFMRNEFTAACKQIDRLGAEKEKNIPRLMFQAISAGDMAERDRLAEESAHIRSTAKEAKVEVWRRISEKYGIPPKDIEALLAKFDPRTQPDKDND